jgi:hypothetical protein
MFSTEAAHAVGLGGLSVENSGILSYPQAIVYKRNKKDLQLTISRSFHEAILWRSSGLAPLTIQPEGNENSQSKRSRSARQKVYPDLSQIGWAEVLRDYCCFLLALNSFEIPFTQDTNPHDCKCQHIGRNS